MFNFAEKHMRIYWYKSKSQVNEFTVKLLEYWFRVNGGENVSDTENPDIVAVSICSSREITTLVSAKKKADSLGVPLLVGGSESYIGATLLAWADYLCVGEGYGLVKDLAKNGFDALKRGNVLCRDDMFREVNPDYEIPWLKLPAIQTAEKSYYFLHGRGCHKKCKFCFTSWTQPHQVIDSRCVYRVKKSIPKGKHIIYVTNDDGMIASGAGSTTVKRFLEYETDKWPKVIRLGVEGITEERRKFFSKYISTEQLADAIKKSIKIKRQLQLFFIIGFCDDPKDGVFDELANIIGVEKVRFPRIYFKFTWFESSPHTPLGRFDLKNLDFFDCEKNLLSMRAISGRYRLFKPGKQGSAVWNSVFRRLPPDLAAYWYLQKNKSSDLDAESVCNLAVDKVGIGYVDGSGDYPWKEIKCRIK